MIYLIIRHQIIAVTRKGHEFRQSIASDSTLRIADVLVAAIGSRAHLEEQALATVESC